jgi:molecular chaperone GrpE
MTLDEVENQLGKAQKGAYEMSGAQKEPRQELRQELKKNSSAPHLSTPPLHQLVELPMTNSTKNTAPHGSSPSDGDVTPQPTPMPADLEAVLRDAEEYAEGKASPRAPAAEDAKGEGSEGGKSAEGAGAEELTKLKAELAAAQQKAEQLQEAALRARADLDNARRRFEREQKESVKFASERALKALIPVVDDLDLTLSNLSDEAEAQLAEGVRLVHRKFLQALESQGATSFYPVGEPFDPTSHEALMEQPSAEHEPGTIVQVFQRGWHLNERLLRPAKVIIAKAV